MFPSSGNKNTWKIRDFLTKFEYIKQLNKYKDYTHTLPFPDFPHNCEIYLILMYKAVRM